MMVSTRTAAGLAPSAAPPLRSRRRARAGEALLADALEREARAPLGRVAVLVRLSALGVPGEPGTPPRGPRPYHRRIARALLEDCAQRQGGQVLALAGGDLVLLAVPAGRPGGDGLNELPKLLVRLLQAEAAGPEPVAEAIGLAEGRARLLALLDAPETDEAAMPPRPRNIFAGRAAPGLPGLPQDAVARLLAGGVAPLLRLQTAARLPPRGAPAATPIRPVHRALRIVPALLAARLEDTLPGDPWLRQHLSASLAAAVLDVLCRAWGGGGTLDAAPRRAVPPLLLALPPAVVNGAGFDAFAALFPPGTTAARMPRVAIAMAEAAADPAGFAAARARLEAAGMALVLDGLSHHSLVLARPEALAPGLIALAWSSALPRLPAERAAEVAAAVARIGAARVLLTGADGEAALRWGRSAGIQLFQGQHAEAMLAATRFMACPLAASCRLRACAERATATEAAGRAGCGNPRLLDQGVPDPVHAVA